MRALSGIYSFLASRQGMVSASARDASTSGPGRAALPPRGLFKLGESSVLAISAGDLTKWKGDAIVNAANEGMLGGGGVDGAIHRAAGRQLMEACYEIQPVPNSRGIRCPTGEARITPGFHLDAKFVIHTVGPVYENKEVSAPLLRSAIKNSLLLCKEEGLKSIAFPAISCGVYGYPAEEAAAIAIDTMREFSEGIDLIEFVLFGKDTYVPFFAKASEKLKAMQETDGEMSPDKAEDKEKPQDSTEGEKKGDDVPKADAEHSPPSTSAPASATPECDKPHAPKCDAPAGATSEVQDVDTAVKPMSQEELCGALDDALDPTEGGEPMSQSGPEELMSQETIVGGLGEALDLTEGGEPMSQSGPKESEEMVAGKAHDQASSSETADAPEDSVPGRKRSAPGAMETDETTQDETQTTRDGEEERGATVPGTSDSSAPNKGP